MEEDKVINEDTLIKMAEELFTCTMRYATVGNCKFRQPPSSPFSGLLVKSELVATVAY